MKSIASIVIFAILLFSIFSTNTTAVENNDSIILEDIIMSAPELIYKEEFISVNLPQANSFYWETGEPLLPSINKIFTFPFGTKIINVRVELTEKTTCQLSKKIEPAPEAQNLLIINNNNSLAQSSDFKYSYSRIYPPNIFSYKTSAGKSGNEHVIYCSININPIQYNSQENTLTYAQNAEIKIKYTPPAQTINFPDEYDLLILTSTEFQSTIQRFIDHKEGRGIRTKLVTLPEIPNTGVDTQESIKYFIKEAIETWGVDYLILIGSGLLGEAKFPFRYAWIGDQYEDFFPSDLYYADIYNSSLGFSNWDHDRDDKFAEYPDDIDSMDIVPDIYMARIPCDTISELNSYIDKVIWYDNYNKMTNKIVLIGGDTFPEDDGIYEGEYVNTKVKEQLPYYSDSKLWGSNNKLKKVNIALKFSSCSDYIDFSGHGDVDRWATHPPKDSVNWIPKKTFLSPNNCWSSSDFNLYLVKNEKKYPIIFYNACSNNKFTKSIDCLSWKTLKQPNGGGIIAFGASGIGKGVFGTLITERYFGWMEVQTFRELYNTKNLGKVWANCVRDYYLTFQDSLSNNDYKTVVEYSMFGDPTLNAADGDDPKIKSMKSYNYKILEIVIDILPIFKKFFLNFLVS